MYVHSIVCKRMHIYIYLYFYIFTNTNVKTFIYVRMHILLLCYFPVILNETEMHCSSISAQHCAYPVLFIACDSVCFVYLWELTKRKFGGGFG